MSATCELGWKSEKWAGGATTLRAGSGELVVGEALEVELEGDRGFAAGELGAETDVDARPERDVNAKGSGVFGGRGRSIWRIAFRQTLPTP